ncbi:hypothetical protein MUK42_09919 [Musa troglodytarum]|uniref:Uncharacterized protein n=1 Tax=Musa troglodytarum TaxID=320322 RepID=A0A9E7JJC4_9LILI|nr:hypothetical protein MUK42_09919 [Musa troglodytarum]
MLSAIERYRAHSREYSSSTKMEQDIEVQHLFLCEPTSSFYCFICRQSGTLSFCGIFYI